MEGILDITLFGHAGWFIGFTVILLIFLFSSEIEENGYVAAIAFAAYSILFYIWGNIPVSDIFSWDRLIAYLVIGFFYAGLRTFLFARKEQRKFLEKRLDSKRYWDNSKTKTTYGNMTEEESREKYLKDNEYKKESVRDHAGRWWLLWPVSLLKWTFTDLIKQLGHFLYDVWSRVFKFFYALGERSVKIDE